MNAERTDLKLARQLYQPDISMMRNSLPDLGESLHTAAIDLERDCTLERLDGLAAKLNSAYTSLQHLRKAMVQENNHV